LAIRILSNMSALS